jgi:hypothetical protein
MRWLAVLLVVMLTACSTKLGKDGRTDTSVDLKYLAKSEVDRIAVTNRAEVVNGLLLIADKLYKRNPKEWKKSGAVSRERPSSACVSAVSQLASSMVSARAPWPHWPLPKPVGDRVMALVSAVEHGRRCLRAQGRVLHPRQPE